MKTLKCSPFDLVKNPWNSNRVDRENFEKLKVSMKTLGAFKPIVCRELTDGSLQILGGFHRVEAAKELGWTEIDVYNLGRLDDNKAKEISLIDNTRYGKDDEELLAKLLEEMDTTGLDLILPEAEELELPETDTEIEETEIKERDDEFKTLRFRLETDKAEEIEAILNDVCKAHGYKLIDGYNDLAMGLYHLLVLEGK